MLFRCWMASDVLLNGYSRANIFVYGGSLFRSARCVGPRLCLAVLECATVSSEKVLACVASAAT